MGKCAFYVTRHNSIYQTFLNLLPLATDVNDILNESDDSSDNNEAEEKQTKPAPAQREEIKDVAPVEKA